MTILKAMQQSETAEQWGDGYRMTVGKNRDGAGYEWYVSKGYMPPHASGVAETLDQIELMPTMNADGWHAAEAE